MEDDRRSTDSKRAREDDTVPTRKLAVRTAERSLGNNVVLVLVALKVGLVLQADVNRVENIHERLDQLLDTELTSLVNI